MKFSNFSLQIYCTMSILEIFQIDVLIQDALHDVCAAARVGVGELAVQLPQHILQANTKKDKLKTKKTIKKQANKRQTKKNVFPG